MATKLLILILNGLTQAAIFFVLGSGLTLAFGLMRVINLSHGAFYLLGGYIGYSVVHATGNWPLALVVGGSRSPVWFLFERTMLFRVRGGDLPETLLTVALSMIIADVSLAIWGGHPLTLNVPAYLNPRSNDFWHHLPRFPVYPHGYQRLNRAFAVAGPSQDEARSCGARRSGRPRDRKRFRREYRPGSTA